MPLHGDLDLRISKVSMEIEASPFNTELRIQRGELYLQHEDFEKAKQDFLFCLDRKAENLWVDLGLGHSYFFLNQFDSTLYYVGAALLQDPENLSAIELQASSLSKLGRYCESAAAAEKMLTLGQNASPFIYLMAVNSLKNCEQSGSIAKAISTLENGIEKMGTNAVLEHELVILLLENHQYEQALIWQTRLIDQSTLKIPSLMDRARIYIAMEQYGSAKTDLLKAKTDWDHLPPRKKELPSILSMIHELDQLMANLKK